MRRHRCTADMGKGRQQVDVYGQFVAYRSSRNGSFPLHQAGYTLTALEAGALAFPQTACASGMVAVINLGTIVGGYHHQRILIQTLFA